MSKQRVFKPNYLLRGKQHNKTSNTLFQLQKYDCHMLVPSPFCLLACWSSRFLVFCHFWFVESAGNTVVSVMWLAEEDIDHFVIYLGAGPFKYTFTSQGRTYWNFRMSARAFGDTFQITLSHIVFTPVVVHNLWEEWRFFFCFFCNTGSIHCMHWLHKHVVVCWIMHFI